MLKSGSKFGRLTVIEDRGHKNVLCKCSCGTFKSFLRNNLVRGNTSSCGCLKSEKLKERWRKHSEKVSPKKDKVFGRLSVTKIERQYIICRCTCGKEKRFYKYDVLSGKVLSCGCLNREKASERMSKMLTKHGGWGSREWNLWNNMNRRCNDLNAMGYENYGGRGIKVCSRWSGNNGFKYFLEDMGSLPGPKHSLDRINVNGNYTPDNVRWATHKEQARNRRSNRMITAFGKTQCLIAWAEEVGLSSTTISLRILKGKTPEEALTKLNK